MIHIGTYKVIIPFKKRFTISKGGGTEKTNILVVLNDRYCGEVSGSVVYGPPLQIMENELVHGIEIIKNANSFTIDSLDEINNFSFTPPVRAALMGIVLHYLSGETNKFPWQLLSIDKPANIRTSFTFGIENPDQTIDAINKSPYPIIKIKMGGPDDRKLIELFPKIKGKDIRVDANGGWNTENAEEMINLLANQGVNFIEQPTDPEFVKEWKHLKGKHSKAILMMDEGMKTANDFSQWGDFIDGVNIKMAKCGGIIEGVKLAKVARAANKKIMLGCMVDSSLGIAQSVYMSSLADFWDLDGPLLLENDIASGIEYSKEKISVDSMIPGGPILKNEMVDRYVKH